MQITTSDIILSLLSAVTGGLISLFIGWLVQKYKFKQEFKSNNAINLAGNDWYAAWQTSVNGKEILNTERLCFTQRGGTVRCRNLEKSPENPEGGYLWTSQMQFFFGRDLMGWYFPVPKENNSSKGMLFLNHNAPQKLFIGMWVGASYDGPLTTGFVVISKERQKSLSKLKEILKKHPCTVPIISNVIEEIA